MDPRLTPGEAANAVEMNDCVARNRTEKIETNFIAVLVTCCPLSPIHSLFMKAPFRSLLPFRLGQNLPQMPCATCEDLLLRN
jgi:hypothetical protein